MNLLQTIWSVLTTPNETVIRICSIPLTIIEVIIGTSLFINILNLKSTKKNNIIFISILSLMSIISNYIIPAPYGTILRTLVVPFLIYFIFRTSIIKSIVASLLPSIFSAILDTIISKTYLSIFNITYIIAIQTPIHRICITLIIYSIILLISLLSKHFNLNIYILDDLSKKSKLLFFFNTFSAFIVIAIQFYIIVFYMDNISTFVSLLSLFSLSAYIFISLYSLINTTKLEIANRDLEEARMYNKTLSMLHDNIRAFKHDFGNIVQTIGRICSYRGY